MAVPPKQKEGGALPREMDKKDIRFVGETETVYDVVIVGGGPAGATFARQLHGNYRVLLLDGQGGKAKPCGGLLAPDAQRALARFALTLPKDILVDPQIFSVKTLDVKTGRIRHYPRSYLNLDRSRFDRWLLSLLPPCIQVCEGWCRSITRDKEGFVVRYTTQDGREYTVRTTCIVGADGAHSLVRRTFFPDCPFTAYVAIQQWFASPQQSPFYSCVLDPATSDCCSWSIFKDRYFVFGGAFRPRHCREAFERQKSRLKDYGFVFGEPLKTEACLVRRPMSLREVCCGKDGVFLIGEAAGFISPSSLEGISWAMNSAALLGKVLSVSLKDGNQRYQRATRPLRRRLWLKMRKCPFMYTPFLRQAVMWSGLQAIDVEE